MIDNCRLADAQMQVYLTDHFTEAVGIGSVNPYLMSAISTCAAGR